MSHFFLDEAARLKPRLSSPTPFMTTSFNAFLVTTSFNAFLVTTSFNAFLVTTSFNAFLVTTSFNSFLVTTSFDSFLATIFHFFPFLVVPSMSFATFVVKSFDTLSPSVFPFFVVPSIPSATSPLILYISQFCSLLFLTTIFTLALVRLL